MKTYLVSYYKNGTLMGSEIQAEDFADAAVELAEQKLGDFAKVDGEFISSTPVPALFGRNTENEYD